MEQSISSLMAPWVQIGAVLLSGLLAGLFYGYDCSVIKGLGNLSDKAYLQSFQSINKEIINPYFFLSFGGSMIVLPLSAWLAFKTGQKESFYLLLTASLVYWIGVFGITGFGNVPLNNLVARFNLSTASDVSIAAMRQRFETKWNLLHHFRTYAAMISFLLAIISLVSNRK